jgi:MiaB-like tRNA modifying enzyme
MIQKNIYLETYGCSANQNNSEIIAGILSRAGNLITNNQEIAEVIILNTCVVKGKTESKIKKRIQELKSSKKIIIITGCMPETDFKKIKKLNPNVIMLGTHNIKDIINVIRDYQDKKLDGKKQNEYLKNNKEIKLNLPKLPQNKLISIHQISEGCLGNCSYCKTKLAKGDLFSYPQKEIIKSVESDLQNNAKEIWIASQDNAAYGLDLKEKKRELPKLLKEILNLKYRFKLRLGMSDPNNILPILKDMIEVYKDKKMYKFLHIPIQSASNKILKDMNRFYTIEEAEKIIIEFRKNFPEGIIATDLIVGYPTETQEDHNKNIEFLEKYKPEVLNLSKFSSHKETRAGKLKILENGIIRKRTAELMDIHKRTAKEHKKQYLNKNINIFIDKKIGDSLHEARDINYNKIFLKCPKELLGKETEVRITSTGVHNMVGEVIKNT